MSPRWEVFGTLQPELFFCFNLMDPRTITPSSLPLFFQTPSEGSRDGRLVNGTYFRKKGA